MNLQRSNYIKIDDEVKDPKQKPIADPLAKVQLGGNKVVLKFKYVDGNHINKKWQSHQVYKTRFLCQISHMKDQG